jgi:saccharopine dehydrogenase-like NADP-dependent oxidoreductase
MHDVLLLGAGKIGRAIAKLLANSGDYRVLVGDVEPRALARLADIPHVTTVQVDVSDPAALRRVMVGRTSVLSACSFAVNPGIAQAALDTGLSYFDLTEDVSTTRAVNRIAAKAGPGQIFMPQCGLAPGFISIAGHHLTQQFDKLDAVRLRVGALPQFPTNELKYNLTWSTDGLINEYCNPCEVIHDGERIEVLPLEGLEHFSLDGIDYEAFNTSGGLGTLWETLKGKVRNLDYKTVRYLGHRDLVAFLVNELRLSSRRAILKDILENSVPITLQDVVLVFCTVTGWKDGYLTQVTDARKIYAAEVFGETWSAIQITTAAGICTVVDLHHGGKLRDRGFVRQEEVGLDVFLANRFGRYYQSSREPLAVKTA